MNLWSYKLSTNEGYSDQDSRRWNEKQPIVERGTDEGYCKC